MGWGVEMRYVEAWWDWVGVEGTGSLGWGGIGWNGFERSGVERWK